MLVGFFMTLIDWTAVSVASRGAGVRRCNTCTEITRSWPTPRMAFHVAFPNHPQGHYHDKDVYKFLEGGVLTIRHHDGAVESEYYAPHSWDYVGADKDHEPGKTK